MQYTATIEGWKIVIFFLFWLNTQIFSKHNLCLEKKNEKKCIPPVNTSFTIKVGCKGV